jgi:L-rhamnose mutarotase
MRRVMVRYKVKPDQVEENEQLVREVYKELGRLRPEGFRYGTFKLEDGVSFVHLAVQDTDHNPLSEVEAFQRFQADIRSRCDEPPVVATLEEVGSYRFDGVPA